MTESKNQQATQRPIKFRVIASRTRDSFHCATAAEALEHHARITQAGMRTEIFAGMSFGCAWYRITPAQLRSAALAGATP